MSQTHLVNKDEIYLFLRTVFFFNNGRIGHFRVQKPSLLERGQVQNLSCENEFYLHDNKKSFTQERVCTWPRFKTEACDISEID